MSKVVSPEAVLQLERDLVQEIINNYLEVRSFVYEKRKAYLNSISGSNKNAVEKNEKLFNDLDLKLIRQKE